MSDERSIAFRRSRTRSCAVRRRFLIAASSLDAESSTSPASSTLRSIRSRRAGMSARDSASSTRWLPRHPGEALPEAAGGPQRLTDVEQLGSGEAAAAARALEWRANVARAADPGLGLVLDELRCLVRLLLQQADERGVGHRQDRLREFARGRERGPRREQRRDGRELQRPQRGGVRGCASGRLSARHGDRPRSSTDTAARPTRPRTRRRCAARWRSAPARSRLDADRSRAPGRRRCRGDRSRTRAPGCQDRGPAGRPPPSPRAHPSKLVPLVDLRRPQEDRLRLGARPADDVRAMVEAVNQVDVERTRTSEHHRVACRAPARRVCRQVFRPLVRLHLDDPAADRARRANHGRAAHR